MEGKKKRTLDEVDIDEPTPLEKISKNEKTISIDEMMAAGLIGPVQIDGINFYLLGKIIRDPIVDPTVITPVVGRYPKVAILSGTPDDPENRSLFWVYQSESEVGMWRICFILKNSDQIDKLVTLDRKGDYVQSTLIVIELQRFINNNIDNLPIYNTPAGVFYSQLSPQVSLYGLPYSDIISKGNCPVFDEAMYPELAVRDREIRPEFEPFKTICKLPCGVSRIRGKDGITKQISISVITRFLENFSESFKRLYRITDNVLIYPGYSASMATSSPIITTNGDIYSVTLTTNNEGIVPDLRIIRLIYLRTTSIINGPEPTKVRPNYYMPITLIPAYSVCNKYGVYSGYISAGLYMCKLFEYNNQCSPQEYANKVCTDTYTFLGERYPVLFPYAEIEESIHKPPPPQEIATQPDEETATQPLEEETVTQEYGGGKRRKRSSRSRRRNRSNCRKRNTKKRNRKTRGRSRRRHQ